MTHAIQFAPGPNLPIASNEDAPKRKIPPADMPLPERLRLYSPTSGYARYTAMAADRIDELNGINAAQQATISRIKRILEERNYRVHALTIADEHHKANEEKLLRRLAELSKDYKDLDEDYKSLLRDVIDLQDELDASKRGFWATIFNCFKGSKK